MSTHTPIKRYEVAAEILKQTHLIGTVIDASYTKVGTFPLSYFPHFILLTTASKMSKEISSKQLIAKRSSINSHLTHFQRYLGNISECNISQNYIVLQTELDNMIERQNLFDNVQANIELVN